MKIPTLMQLLFGDAAETAQRMASRRLKRWSAAFDDWLEERYQQGKRDNNRRALQEWRRLLQECHKPPYELSQADIAAHADWMRAQDYKPGTIDNMLGMISSFYEWCAEKQIDPACAPGFNPARGAPRRNPPPYAGAKLLSRGEVQALLNLLQRDETPLGRRDYAFILAEVRLGTPLRNLQHIQWKQIEEGRYSVSGIQCSEEEDKGRGVRVRWRKGEEPEALPEEVWEAIRRSLETSGRWQGMQAEEYIFAPIKPAGRLGNSDRAQDWAGERCLSGRQIRDNLKLYGRRAGIPEEKLNLLTLRRTAIRLRLEEAAGAAAEAMRSFSNGDTKIGKLKYRLGFLPALPLDEEAPGGEESEPPLPDRRSKIRPGRRGEWVKHGWNAHSLPARPVQAVLAENIQGVDAEIAGLRTLARGLLTLQEEGPSRAQALDLANAYTLAAARLAALIETAGQLAQPHPQEQWALNVLDMFNRQAAEGGYPPVSMEALRAWLLGEAPELNASAQRTEEETAATRWILRNTLELAGPALEQGETREYLRLVEVYGSACNRLMRLLRSPKGENDRMKAAWRAIVDRAIQGTLKGWDRENLRRLGAEALEGLRATWAPGELEKEFPELFKEKGDL